MSNKSHCWSLGAFRDRAECRSSVFHMNNKNCDPDTGSNGRWVRSHPALLQFFGLLPQSRVHIPPLPLQVSLNTGRQVVSTVTEAPCVDVTYQPVLQRLSVRLHRGEVLLQPAELLLTLLVQKGLLSAPLPLLIKHTSGDPGFTQLPGERFSPVSPGSAGSL